MLKKNIDIFCESGYYLFLLVTYFFLTILCDLLMQVSI